MSDNQVENEKIYYLERKYINKIHAIQQIGQTLLRFSYFKEFFPELAIQRPRKNVKSGKLLWFSNKVCWFAACGSLMLMFQHLYTGLFVLSLLSC